MKSSRAMSSSQMIRTSSFLHLCLHTQFVDCYLICIQSKIHCHHIQHFSQCPTTTKKITDKNKFHVSLSNVRISMEKMKSTISMELLTLIYWIICLMLLNSISTSSVRDLKNSLACIFKTVLLSLPFNYINSWNDEEVP